MKKQAFSIAMSIILLNTAAVSTSADTMPMTGRLLYHSYSTYTALDSKIYLHNFADGTITEINSDEFVNPMNADFGSHSYDITFMAIDTAHDEWDIYRYNLINNKIENLTYASGFRNEDPKFSPDGNKIVFKRGYWNNSVNNFLYNLAEINLLTGDINMLTDDLPEDSMPCYSADGETIYYAQLNNGISSICELDTDNMTSKTIFAEKDVTSYYPMTSDNGLYFTKWLSADNMTDTIVKFENGNVIPLPFSDGRFNCSDPFPCDNGNTFYSSTQNGSYDLFLYDGNSSNELVFLNTELNELGSSYFSDKNADDITSSASDFILGRTANIPNADADGNKIVDSFDMIYLRRQ